MPAPVSYRAGGRVIPLTSAPQMALDISAAEDAGLATAALREMAASGQALRAGIVLLPIDAALEPKEKEELDREGAIHPVYLDPTGSTVVVLPEVRVEIATDDERESLAEALRAQGERITIVDATDRRVVLRPSSGRGFDALQIANELYDEAHPAMCQPRILRVVPRDSVVRPA